MSVFAAVTPPNFDVLEDDNILDHPVGAYTYDGVMQVGTKQDWQDAALQHRGLIELPDGTVGAPVARIEADDHEHRSHDWWRTVPDHEAMYLGTINGYAVQTPEKPVVDTAENWAALPDEYLWFERQGLRLVRVPSDTSGVTIAQWLSSSQVPGPDTPLGTALS